MRRIDRETDSLFALKVLDKYPYTVLSMITAENVPYYISLSIVRIWNKIYFHPAKEGRKTSTLRQHLQVYLCCVGDIHCMQNKFTLNMNLLFSTVLLKKFLMKKKKFFL